MAEPTAPLDGLVANQEPGQKIENDQTNPEELSGRSPNEQSQKTVEEAALVKADPITERPMISQSGDENGPLQVQDLGKNQESVNHTLAATRWIDIGKRVAKLVDDLSATPARQRELLSLTTDVTCQLIEAGRLQVEDLTRNIRERKKKVQEEHNWRVNEALGFAEPDDKWGYRWTKAAPKDRKNLAHLNKKCQRVAVALTDMEAKRSSAANKTLEIDSAGVAKRFGETPVLLGGRRKNGISHSFDQCAKFAVEDHGPPKQAESPINPWQQFYNFLCDVKKRDKLIQAERKVAQELSDLLADILELPLID